MNKYNAQPSKYSGVWCFKPKSQHKVIYCKLLETTPRMQVFTNNKVDLSSEI